VHAFGQQHVSDSRDDYYLDGELLAQPNELYVDWLLEQYGELHGHGCESGPGDLLSERD